MTARSDSYRSFPRLVGSSHERGTEHSNIEPASGNQKLNVDSFIC